MPRSLSSRSRSFTATGEPGWRCLLDEVHHAIADLIHDVDDDLFLNPVIELELIVERLSTRPEFVQAPLDLLLANVAAIRARR